MLHEHRSHCKFKPDLAGMADFIHNMHCLKYCALAGKSSDMVYLYNNQHLARF